MSNWFFIPQPNPTAKVRFFCFPYAGAGATLFNQWPSFMPDTVELVAFQPPGREMRFREEPVTSWSEMVKYIVREIDDYLDKPAILFGYCVGSIVAFEVARALQETGKPVQALLVAARFAPSIPEPRQVHTLPDDQLVTTLAEYNATPADILNDASLLKILLPSIRADFQISETYQYTPEPKLTIPVTAFRGGQDQAITSANMQAWQETTTNSFALRTLPGGHFFIHDAQPIFKQMLRQTIQKIIKQL